MTADMQRPRETTRTAGDKDVGVSRVKRRRLSMPGPPDSDTEHLDHPSTTVAKIQRIQTAPQGLDPRHAAALLAAKACIRDWMTGPAAAESPSSTSDDSVEQQQQLNTQPQAPRRAAAQAARARIQHWTAGWSCCRPEPASIHGRQCGELAASRTSICLWTCSSTGS